MRAYPAATARSTSGSSTAGARSTRCRCRSTAGSATACRSASTTPGSSTTTRSAPRGSSTTPTAPSAFRADQEQANELLEHVHPQQAHLEGELRVGSAGPHAESHGAEGDRLDRQRLAALGRVDRLERRHDADHRRRRRLQRRLHLHQRRRQREHHRLAGLRAAACASSATPAAAAAATCIAVQHRGVPGPAGRQRRAGVAAPATCAAASRALLDLAIARNIHAGRRAQPAAPRRHVQRAEPARSSSTATPR